jgi:DNA-binding PadR family transcriptional regulator
MTETAFYMLLSLQVPRHGYGITKYVSELTKGRIKLGSGTIYGTLTKMQRDEMIEVYDDSDKKIVYVITDLGKKVLAAEKERIALLYHDSLTADEGAEENV